MRSASVAPLLVAVALTTSALAEPRELRFEPAVDGAVTAIGGFAWLGSELLLPVAAPNRCRWCEPPPVDVAMRRALRWRATGPAHVLSTAYAFGLAPVAAVGLTTAAALDAGDDGSALAVDLVLVAEATVLALNLNQAVKLVVARERPFVGSLSADEVRRTARRAEDHLSFYSGHTTVAAAIFAAAGTTATLRGYRLAPLAWGLGAPVALTTGYLRIAADRHYFTDVVGGLVLGAAVGIAVPLLHDGGASSDSRGTATAPILARFGGTF